MTIKYDSLYEKVSVEAQSSSGTRMSREHMD